MIIKFNGADEFVAELKKEPLAKPLVRLTYLRRANEKVAPLTSLFIIGTAKTADGDIIKLEHYCGPLWGVGQEDEKAKKHGEDTYHYIEEACAKLNLEVRAGIYEEGKRGQNS